MQNGLEILGARRRYRAAFVVANGYVKMIPVDVIDVAPRIPAKSVRNHQNIDNRASASSAKAVQFVVGKNLAALVEQQLLEEDAWLDLPIVSFARDLVEIERQPVVREIPQLLERCCRFIPDHLDVTAAVVGLHDERIRQRVEYFFREDVGRSQQRYDVLFADFPRNILADRQLVGQLDEPRVGPQAFLQDLFVERSGAQQVRIAANFLVMQQAQKYRCWQHRLG